MPFPSEFASTTASAYNNSNSIQQPTVLSLQHQNFTWHISSHQFFFRLFCQLLQILARPFVAPPLNNSARRSANITQPPAHVTSASINGSSTSKASTNKNALLAAGNLR
jgi:hypothetical protein